jgi:6-pyruvoyltetrahydropterin/6-carboxytetrahydropterin synthase
MYRISKEFTFAMGHRLSCHQGACKNFHGHNYKVEIGVKSEKLNKDGMVIDFGYLKSIVEMFLDEVDHALMVNDKDHDFVDKLKKHFPFMKVIETPFEPTAENMSREIFEKIGKKLKEAWGIDIDYVVVWETDTSKATYSIE